MSNDNNAKLSSSSSSVNEKEIFKHIDALAELLSTIPEPAAISVIAHTAAVSSDGEASGAFRLASNVGKLAAQMICDFAEILADSATEVTTNTVQ